MTRIGESKTHKPPSQKVEITVDSKRLRIYFQVFGETHHNLHCLTCGAPGPTFVVSFRVRAIYEFETDLPILTSSELGRAAVSRLHSILRTQDVACDRHKGELEAVRLSALRDANRKFINLGG